MKNKWHCEVCKFFRTNKITMAWNSLGKRTKTLLIKQGWNEQSYGQFMQWVDHSPGIQKYAQYIIQERVSNNIKDFAIIISSEQKTPKDLVHVRIQDPNGSIYYGDLTPDEYAYRKFKERLLLRAAITTDEAKELDHLVQGKDL